MCQTSLIVVRGNDDRVRAFHNMCSHRGNKLAWDKGGSCKGFSCKFHGWSFGLDGQLGFVPDEEDFFDLNREDEGLTPVACDLWEGFIFINVDPNPKESLLEFLGELANDLSGYPFDELTASSNVWTTDINANWKLAKDSFSENYHIKFLHKRTAPNTMTSASNPFSHFLDVKLYPRHAKAAVAGYRSKPGPIDTVGALAAKHGASNFVVVNGAPPGVNLKNFEDWTLDLHTIFPNFILITAENSIFVHNFWPIDATRTHWQLTQFFRKAKNVGERFSQEHSNTRVRDVATEDGSTLEQAQSMMASGARQGLFLKDEEVLIRHRHKVVEQLINGDPLIDPSVGAMNQDV